MRWMALGWLALSGCVIPSGPTPDDDPIVSNGETQESCVIAASDGGDGGPGGILSIRTARDPFLAGTIAAEGGEAGPAGTPNLGPSAVAGAAGPAGRPAPPPRELPQRAPPRGWPAPLPGHRVRRRKAQPARGKFALGRQKPDRAPADGAADLRPPPHRALCRSFGLADARRPSA